MKNTSLYLTVCENPIQLYPYASIIQKRKNIIFKLKSVLYMNDIPHIHV